MVKQVRLLCTALVFLLARTMTIIAGIWGMMLNLPPREEVHMESPPEHDSYRVWDYNKWVYFDSITVTPEEKGNR